MWIDAWQFTAFSLEFLYLFWNRPIPLYYITLNIRWYKIPSWRIDEFCMDNFWAVKWNGFYILFFSKIPYLYGLIRTWRNHQISISIEIRSIYSILMNWEIFEKLVFNFLIPWGIIFWKILHKINNWCSRSQVPYHTITCNFS